MNLTKTMLMRNERVSDGSLSLNGTSISECSSYAFPAREVNMANDMAPELGRRKRVAWKAFKSVEEVVKRTKKPGSVSTYLTPLFFFRLRDLALFKSRINA